jgi:hypothetical protein
MSLAPVITQPPSRWKRHHATACAPSATVVLPAPCSNVTPVIRVLLSARRLAQPQLRRSEMATCRLKTLATARHLQLANTAYSQHCLFVSCVGKWGTRGDVVSCLRRQPRECDKYCSSVRNFIVDIASRHSGNTPRWEGYPSCYYSLGGKHTRPRKPRYPHAASFCLRSCNLSRRQHM